jgi:hypothetical protein
VLSAILGIVNLVGLIYVVGWKLGRYELKVDTLWKYVVEAALVDSRQKGVIVSNSPIQVSATVNGHFGGLSAKIKDYYLKHKLYRLSDSEIVWHLYLAFDQDLIEKVCLPYNLNMGQALIAALHICKGAIQTQ